MGTLIPSLQKVWKHNLWLFYKFYNLYFSELPSDEVIKFGRRVEPPSQPSQLAKPSKIPVPQSSSDPLLSSYQAKSPEPRQLPSPGKSPTQVKEMKIEKGPVHQFKQILHPQLTSSNSDPSLSIKSRNNYNSKPRPFGYVPPPASFPSSVSTAIPGATSNQSQESNDKPSVPQGYKVDQSRNRSQSVDQLEPTFNDNPPNMLGTRSSSTSDSIRFV